MSTVDFPTLLGLGWPVRTPIFNNLYQQASNLKESSATLASAPRWKWKLPFEMLRDDANNELKTLVGFVCTRLGSSDKTFLFTDPDDNSVTAQGGGSGDGATKIFQLVRTYGGFVEPIAAPITVANLKVNNVAKSNPTDYTFDTTTGLLTFVVAPGNGLAIVYDLTYKWRCRFLNDSNDFEKFLFQMWSQKGIEFISVK